MKKFSLKTGDYASLSSNDLTVLALLHDLHIELYGADHLNYECRLSNKGTKQSSEKKGVDKNRCAVNMNEDKGKSSITDNGDAVLLINKLDELNLVKSGKVRSEKIFYSHIF